MSDLGAANITSQMHTSKTLGPLVTIGVAVFNGGRTLRIALESLACQTYSHLEIVICDEGSTDGSFELCKEFAAANPNCRLFRNESRLGIAQNYNKLIGLARGKYFVFADQDDRRESTFVSRCVEVLEEDSDAVLCHSFTGVVWPGIQGSLYHINTLNSIDGVESVVSRYWRFLRRCTDTTIYGLIRLDALKRTKGWQQRLGSANRLLFELILIGPFRQVPDLLFWYTGKGLKFRPTPAEEYTIQTGGGRMPRYYLPFLGIAWSQSRSIISSHHTILTKISVLGILWIHVVLTAITKAAYRLAWRLWGDRLPKTLERRCSEIVYSTSDIRFIIAPDEDPDLYVQGWPLRKS